MSNNLEQQSSQLQDSVSETQPVTPDDLSQVIQEFEQYRERLVGDMTSAAKKAKLSKSKLMSQLEPELAQLDATLDKLRTQYANLTNG